MQKHNGQPNKEWRTLANTALSLAVACLLAGSVATAEKVKGDHMIPASELIGTDVKNSKDEVVGEVHDIIVLNDSGDIPFAVVSFGGIFEPDDLFAIPWKALVHNHEDGVCVLNVSMLKDEPEGNDKREWLEVDEDRDDDEIADDTVNPLGDYWIDDPAEEKADSQTRHHRSQALSTNKVIGAEVMSRAGEEAGEIHDLIVDLDQGRVAHIVFAAGGILGVGQDEYLCPWKSMTHSREEGTVTTDITKERLEALPKYEEE